MGRGERGENRGDLLADVRPGTEPRGISQQRPEGGGEQSRPARRSGNLVGAHLEIYGQTGERAAACSQLFSASLCPVCRTNTTLILFRTGVITTVVAYPA